MGAQFISVSSHDSARIQRALTSRIYWTRFLSDAAHAMGNDDSRGIWARTVRARCYTLDITSRISPSPLPAFLSFPLFRLSESRERITSILVFLRASVSLYCLCTNDNGTLSSHRTYTHVRSHGTRVRARRRFGADSLRRNFRAAFPPS